MSFPPVFGRFSHLGAATLLVACGELASLAHAQSGSRVSEQEFLDAVDPSHPAVVALAAELAQAEGARRRGGGIENPTLEFEHEAPSDQPDQTTVKLGWTPPLDGRRGLAVGAGEASVEAARQELEWARLRLRQDVRAVFAAWAAAERRRELVVQHHQRLRRLQERLIVRAERGEESQLAAQRFALALSQVRAALARAEAELTRARGRALALEPALPQNATPLLPGLPAVPASLDGPPRPDVLARRHEVEAAALRRRLAGRVLQFPTLMGGWTQIDDGAEGFDGPYLGFSWELPLFDRNQGDRHEAGRQVAIAEARLRLAENEAAARGEAALAGYATLHAAFAEVSDAVATTPAVLEAASAAFLAGEHGTTDLLETLRSVLESQLAALELHTEALAAHRELELSAGRALTGGHSR